MIKRRSNKRKILTVEPDEIFLDSKNLQNFDLQQFEGRIEKTIPKKTILFLGIILFAERGIIYDRNRQELAWNKVGEEDFGVRAYKMPGFAHLLGYVS